MNILTNICNPKQEHFEQEAKTQTYKPLSDYIFQNRTMQKMRAKYQKSPNNQEFKYQSWNHPYSISNFFFHQKGQNQNNTSQMPVQGQMNNAGNQSMWRNENKKISFKDANLPFYGGNREEAQGQFRDRSRQYDVMRRENQQNYGYNTQYRNQDHFQQQQHFNSYQMESNQQNLSSQSYSQNMMSKQMLQLKQQNQDLKRVIEQEYKPMRQLYNKLLSEQEEREYLISKLEWKVRELVKEMGHSNSNISQLADDFGPLSKDKQLRNENKKRESVNMIPSTPYKNLYHQAPQLQQQQNYLYGQEKKQSQIFPQNKHLNLPLQSQQINNHILSGYLNPNNLSTYFPQQQQKLNNTIQQYSSPLKQFEPHNISQIPYINGHNSNNQQNGQFSSNYQPFNTQIQQKQYANKNITKQQSSFLIGTNNAERSIYLPNNNPTQSKYINNPNTSQFNHPQSQPNLYTNNISQIFNHSTYKNY